MIDKKATLQNLVIEAINNGRSQNSISKQMGISPATIINIKNGSWETISDRMINKCLAYFKVDSWPLMATYNYNAIMKLCDLAQFKKRCVAVSDFTGAGKTTALREYTKSHGEVFMVHATNVMNRKLFLGAVQSAMGIRDGFSVPMMLDAIIKKLISCNDPLLIIDDAGKLNHAVLLLIQIIYDETENRAGIVLSGTEYLEDMFKRGVHANRLGYRELYRRISYWQYLKEPSLKAVEELCANYDIKDKNCSRYIHERSNNYGDIRNWITNAVNYREETGNDIDRSVLEDLMVGKAQYSQVKASR